MSRIIIVFLFFLAVAAFAHAPQQPQKAEVYIQDKVGHYSEFHKSLKVVQVKHPGIQGRKTFHLTHRTPDQLKLLLPRAWLEGFKDSQIKVLDIGTGTGTLVHLLRYQTAVFQGWLDDSVVYQRKLA